MGTKHNLLVERRIWHCFDDVTNDVNDGLIHLVSEAFSVFNLSVGPDFQDADLRTSHRCTSKPVVYPRLLRTSVGECPGASGLLALNDITSELRKMFISHPRPTLVNTKLRASCAVSYNGGGDSGVSEIRRVIRIAIIIIYVRTLH
jgi:hypothetical protein